MYQLGWVFLDYFNSRVSTLKDFTDCDENFEQTCYPMSDIDFSFAVDQVDVMSLENLGFSIVRISREKIVNHNGKRLLS